MTDSVPQNSYLRCNVVVPSTPGIYAIVNLVNQHFYVGSAVNLKKRNHHHLRDLVTGKHKNAHLQRAYNLYGSDAFRFDILEHVEHVDNLLTREQHYIDTLNPEYNISRTAGSNFGMSFTPEHRAKISAARRANYGMLEQMETLNAARRGKHLSPEHRAKITANQTGKQVSPETRARMSAAHTGKKKTPEHAANIRAAKLGKKRSPECIAKMKATKAANRAKKLAQHPFTQPPLF